MNEIPMRLDRIKSYTNDVSVKIQNGVVVRQIDALRAVIKRMEASSTAAAEGFDGLTSMKLKRISS